MPMKYWNKLKFQSLIFLILKKNKKLNPSAPFITSTLQLEASNKLGFSPGITMSLAQKLYEGIAVNGDNKGLITYIRTILLIYQKNLLQKLGKL